VVVVVVCGGADYSSPGTESQGHKAACMSVVKSNAVGPTSIIDRGQFL